MVLRLVSRQTWKEVCRLRCKRMFWLGREQLKNGGGALVQEQSVNMTDPGPGPGPLRGRFKFGGSLRRDWQGCTSSGSGRGFPLSLQDRSCFWAIVFQLNKASQDSSVHGDHDQGPLNLFLIQFLFSWPLIANTLHRHIQRQSINDRLSCGESRRDVRDVPGP